MEAKANESVMDERMGTASMQVSREQEIASVIRAKYSIDDQIAIRKPAYSTDNLRSFETGPSLLRCAASKGKIVVDC